MMSVASMHKAVPAFVTVVAKHALNYLPQAPMIYYQARREFDIPLTREEAWKNSALATQRFATGATYMISTKNNRCESKL